MDMQMIEALAQLAKNGYSPVKITEGTEFVELRRHAPQASGPIPAMALLRNDGVVFVPRKDLEDLEEHMRTFLFCLGMYVPITPNGLSDLPLGEMMSQATHRIGVLLEFYQAAGHKLQDDDGDE